ncbi:MAG TPA: deiodinase-like protein [Tepidisphaeraceae bacterium]
MTGGNRVAGSILGLAVGAVLALLIVPQLSYAQNQDGGGRGGALIARIQEQLDDLKLTDDQQAKVKQILDKSREDFKTMANDLIQADPQTRRQRLREFMMGVVDQIKPVLSPEQSAQFEKRLRQMAEQMRGNAPAAQPAAAGGAPAMAGESPATQPAMIAIARPGVFVERLRNAIQGMDLTKEQRDKVDDILLDTRGQFQRIRSEANGNMDSAREKMRPVAQDMHQKILDVLTPEQRDKLHEAMENAADQPGGGGRAGRRGGPGQQPAPQRQPTAPTAQAKGGGEGNAPGPTTSLGDVPETPNAVAVGQEAPEIKLKRLDVTQDFQLSAYKGKLVLLVFGSYSSPTFRASAPKLERLKREYGARVNPIIIYTRENYPVGQWEVQRNKDEGISVEQPADINGRVSLARRAREALKLTVPIAVDNIGDQTAKDYGGFTNAAILIGRDGKVLVRQKWFEPYGIKSAIDEALK